jgi:hypothetical protein
MLFAVLGALTAFSRGRHVQHVEVVAVETAPELVVEAKS